MFRFRGSLRRAEKQDKVTTLENALLRTHQHIGEEAAWNPFYTVQYYPLLSLLSKSQKSSIHLTTDTGLDPDGKTDLLQHAFAMRHHGNKEYYSFEIKNSYSPHLQQTTRNVHQLPTREMEQFIVHLSYQHQRKGTPID